MRAIILAGGRGTRLRPYTSVLPKPLMPIGDRSILEIVIEQLSRHSFRQIVLCVGHLAHLIEGVLSYADLPDTDISYIRESAPLGTAGPLRALRDLDAVPGPFLLMNGDILTSLDYGGLFAHHLASGFAMTVATHTRVETLDYGIIEVGSVADGQPEMVGFLEKPSLELEVSMGVYVLEPSVLDLIPDGVPFDVPQLIHALLEAGENVGVYRYSGFWLDIGRPEDYQQAGELWARANGLLNVEDALEEHAEAFPQRPTEPRPGLTISAFDVKS